MKRWHYFVLAGVVVAAGVYVYLHRQELGIGGPRDTTVVSDQIPASAPRPARITWQMLNRAKDGFKVEMPSDVREIQVPAYTETGGTEQVSMIFSNPDAETTFAVSWADNPPVARINNRIPDRTLDSARDGALIRTQTSLLNETRSAPAGNPARDITAKNAGGGVMDNRILYAGNRLYMLTVAFPAMSARREQDVTRFFNSFTLVEPPGIPETLPLASQPGRN